MDQSEGRRSWEPISTAEIRSDFPDIEKNAVRKTKYYRPITELQAIRVNDVINDVTHRI